MLPAGIDQGCAGGIAFGAGLLVLAGGAVGLASSFTPRLSLNSLSMSLSSKANKPAFFPLPGLPAAGGLAVEAGGTAIGGGGLTLPAGGSKPGKFGWLGGVAGGTAGRPVWLGERSG